jgi:hypothetical protein
MFFNERPAGFERRGHDGGQVHRFLPELNLAPRDAGDIQQVVEQPRQMRHLPIEAPEPSRYPTDSPPCGQ